MLITVNLLNNPLPFVLGSEFTSNKYNKFVLRWIEKHHEFPLCPRHAHSFGMLSLNSAALHPLIFCHLVSHGHLGAHDCPFI